MQDESLDLRALFTPFNVNVNQHFKPDEEGKKEEERQATCENIAPKIVTSSEFSKTHNLMVHGKNTAMLSNIVHTEWPLQQGYTGRCWWDGHAFETPIVSLPRSYDASKSRYSKSLGFFCSWSCARSFAYHHGEEKSIPLLWELRLKLQKNACVITPARHFSEIDAYGGTLSITDFRKDLQFMTPSAWHNVGEHVI